MPRPSKQHRSARGFTIVELVIVVVVIAIISGIVFAVYSGVTQRAKDTAAQNDADFARRNLMLYAAEHGGSFPADISDLNITNSEGVDYQYYVNNATTPKGYCVTATYGDNDSSFYVASNFTYMAGGVSTLHQITPTKGTCPGHGSVVTITNIHPNPSAEVNITGYGQPNGSSIAQSTIRSHSGAESVLVTMPTYGSGGVGMTIMNISASANPYPLKPSTKYTFSAYVYVPPSTVNMRLSAQGAGRTSPTSNPERVSSVKGEWTRIHQTFTTTSTPGQISLQLINDSSTAGGAQFWADSFMLTEGEQPYVYADGDSLGWTWSGSAGNSASSGPAFDL